MDIETIKTQIDFEVQNINSPEARKIFGKVLGEKVLPS